MSTPPRLNELECPNCHGLTWVIDPDYPGRRGADLRRDERRYPCPACGHAGTGWKTRQQAPPEFLLQPHNLYPMTQCAFDHWTGILRTHFPAHRLLAGLGTTFVPRLPAEVAALKAAHARAHPVGEMRDQDGARRADPRLHDVIEWLER